MPVKLGNIEEFKSQVSQGGGLAKQNLYYVKFPRLGFQNLNDPAYELGLFCTAIDIPTRQLTTVDRMIGTSMQKVTSGYVNPSLNATFRVMNDQRVREYFESWQRFILPEYDDAGENRFEAKYPDQYMKALHIYQLERGQSFPLLDKQADINIGPININVGIDIDIGTNVKTNYHWIVDRAFPVSMTSEPFGDEANGVSTIQIEFAYNKWKSEKTNGKQKASIILNNTRIEI